MSERLFNEEFLRRLERLALVARRASAGKTQGERRSPKRGQSVEFSDFRPYVAGDDFRRIDWNAYARLERFFIKLFVEEEDLTVHILIDTSKSMNWGEPDKLDYAIHVAGALGYIALAGLDRVTVTAIGAGQSQPDGGYFSPHRGKRQALPLFNFLEGIPQNTRDNGRFAMPARSDNGDPAQALRAYANTRGSQGASQPGSLILISDLENDGWMEGIRALVSRGFEISLIHILAPDEVEPEMSGDLKLIDSEDTSEIEITADYDLLSRYKSGLREWQENLQRFCSARGILYIPMQTSLPLDDFLFAWLEKQGVLR
jgi:uncharacterized protein (DUF58 family)